MRFANSRKDTYQLADRYQAKKLLLRLAISLEKAVVRVHRRELEEKGSANTRPSDVIQDQLTDFQSQIELPTFKELVDNQVVFKELDAMTGVNAGTKAILVKTGVTDVESEEATVTVPSLLEAVEYIAKHPI